MASNSIAEIIGGTDEETGQSGSGNGNSQTPSGLAGGQTADSLWLKDLELGNDIFGIVGISKIVFISFMWFVYFRAGRTITGYYWATWFSSLLVIYIAWGPVATTWLLIYSGRTWAEEYFFYSAMVSIIGPMVGYFVPLTILILAYNTRRDSGLVFSSPVHFWLGWLLALSIIITSILFELAFLPGVRLWYDIKFYQEPVLETVEEEDTTTTEETEEPEVIEEEEEVITTFMAELGVTI